MASRYYNCRWCGQRVDRYGEEGPGAVWAHRTGNCPGGEAAQAQYVEQLPVQIKALAAKLGKRASCEGDGRRRLLALRRRALKAGAAMADVSAATAAGWREHEEES